MDILLVPGLWLDASSWEAVAPALESAGHRPVALTMPGTGADAEHSAGIGIADWIDAVVARIDASDDPVVLVGHSGGGNVVWGAADARPGRVARVILVDTALPPTGGIISEFPVIDGVIPFPGWTFFDEPDVADLDPQTRSAAAAFTASVPSRVPTDPVELRDERRFSVPVTVLAGSADQAAFLAMLTEWPAAAEEFARVADSEVVRLASGHWPQFSQPERLGAAIAAAVDRTA
ncbi:alpha/beta hydrolase [Microbacterium sp. cx-55]|uniref:alpha/beta fold hydrolase n=1 Tax=Microbacterium sp. cx-55 TaxID=2875948 RepID=UPI001CBAC769|nr:alpha/beta hydrolase [Microbacterium sp. cx-55]MBZ4486485.1 alpha/beta hydrolase [Microbacterium sp. cx-55]UGB36546.1 alpha/beta hydrolase [Microbacterium sp. cx-55]